jgi:hypothetical protein
MTVFQTLLLMALACPASAQTISFEADGEARFIRCTDVYGTASCEMIFDATATDHVFTCVALDDGGAPKASANAIPGAGPTYNDLDASTVARVVCQKLR